MIHYDPPDWAAAAGVAPAEIKLDVIKDGCVIASVGMSRDRSFTTLGKAGSDIVAIHASVSRVHAVFQWSDERRKLYVFDAGSRHGTFLNKKRIESGDYVELLGGFCLKFGASTRLYVVRGLPSVVEEDDTAAPSREQMRRMYERYKRIRREMGDGGGVELRLDYNHEDQFYFDDPKSALAAFLARTGEEEVDYEVEGTVCRLRLEGVVFEQEGENRAECEKRCALEACEYLDRCGMLRGGDEGLVKQRDWEANDYYDSDEDAFFDRTGELEVKRRRRMRRMGAVVEEADVDSMESLVGKMRELIREEVELKRKLEKSSKAEKAAADGDVDSYIESIRNGALDSTERTKLKVRLAEVAQLQKRTEQMAEVAAPGSERWRKGVDELRRVGKRGEVDEAKKEGEQQQGDEQCRPISKGEVKQEGRREEEQKSKRKIEPVSEKPKVEESREEKTREEKPKEEEQISEEQKQEADSDAVEKFIDWVPPPNQTGDGRTRLNDELGY